MKENITQAIKRSVLGRNMIRLSGCQLTLLSPLQEGQQSAFSFSKDVIRLGAHTTADLVLSDPTVSRFHCELRRIGARYLLVDHESTNGTFIGDLQVREAYLNPGCELTLGQVKVRFQPYTEEVRLEVSERSSMGQMVGSSPEMRALYALIDKVAPSDISALIEGETGTGKELVAQALHERSHRAHKPFVVFDCSAVPEHLIESELFGHERGAFSGATRQHKGVFEQADGGTLFLDELGELALHLQPKLLRALESGAVKRVGGEGLVRVDVRVIAATNQPLFELMERGGFREDLYYRIAKLHIALAPLRSRGDDVLVISQRFLERLNQQNEGRRFVEGMDEEASALLRAWSWPGNVRELRNVIERAYTFAERQQISAQDLPVRLRDVWAAQTGEELERSEVSAGLKENEGTEGLYEIPDCYSLKEAKELIISRFERSYLVQLLSRHDSNISAVAREAGIDRRHVYRLMKKYHVE